MLPALIRKFHEAKLCGTAAVTIWGSGEPYREFLYVDDFADACVFLMERHGYIDIGEFVNIGTGEDIKIKAHAALVREIVNFAGEIINDRTKPDGTPKKLLDVNWMTSRGWKAKTHLREGIEHSYAWYTNNISQLP